MKHTARGQEKKIKRSLKFKEPISKRAVISGQGKDYAIFK